MPVPVALSGAMNAPTSSPSAIRSPTRRGEPARHRSPYSRLADVCRAEALERRVLLSAAAVNFGGRAAFATEARPRSVATADVNGDAVPDLIIANQNGNSISVLAGNGDGTFRPQATYATGLSPFSVAASDVNGDGRVDLVTANFEANSLGVMLGNGNGTFAPQATLAAGAGPYSVAVADVNGDGRADLLAADFGDNNLGVLLGNGNGSFLSQSTFAAGVSPNTVVAADVNGDGKIDAIVCSRSADNDVSVLLGNGNGSFQPRATFAAGSFPRSVAAADLNGDGRPDLVTPNFSADNVSVLPGNGDGTFGAPTTFPTGSHPCSVAALDVNSDGKPDLLIANYTAASASVLLGNGDGTFLPQKTFATGASPRAIVAADVSGDANPDLLVADFDDATVSVLLGQVLPAGLVVSATKVLGKVSVLGGAKGRALVTIGNAGSDPIQGSGTIRLLASADRAIDGNDVPVTTLDNVPFNLRARKSKVFNVPFTFPALQTGYYYFIAEVIPSSSIADNGPADNSNPTPAPSYIQQAVVDLAGQIHARLPASVAPGAKTATVIELTNLGTVTYAGPVSLALSAVAPDDTVVHLTPTVAMKLTLRPQKSVTRTLTFVVPVGTPPGAYTLRALIDPSNLITEADDLNNTLSAAGVLTVG